MLWRPSVFDTTAAGNFERCTAGAGSNAPGASGGGPSRLQSARLVGRVAELGSLVHFTHRTIIKTKTALWITAMTFVALVAGAWLFHAFGPPTKARAQRIQAVNSVARPFPQ